MAAAQQYETIPVDKVKQLFPNATPADVQILSTGHTGKFLPHLANPGLGLGGGVKREEAGVRIAKDLNGQLFIGTQIGEKVGLAGKPLKLPKEKKSSFFDDLIAEGVPLIATFAGAMYGLSNLITSLSNVAPGVSGLAEGVGVGSDAALTNGISLTNATGVGVNLSSAGLGVGVQVAPAAFDQALAASTGFWPAAGTALDYASKASKVVTMVNSLTGQKQQIAVGTTPPNGWYIPPGQTPQDASTGAVNPLTAASGAATLAPDATDSAPFPIMQTLLIVGLALFLKKG